MQYMVAPLQEQLQKYDYTGCLALEKNVIAVVTQDRVIDETWKNKLKTELYVLVDYFYWPNFFNILAIGQKYLSFYPPSLFNNNIHS